MLSSCRPCGLVLLTESYSLDFRVISISVLSSIRIQVGVIGLLLACVLFSFSKDTLRVCQHVPVAGQAHFYTTLIVFCIQYEDVLINLLLGEAQCW